MSAIVLSGASRAFASQVERAFDNSLNGDLRIESVGASTDPSEAVRLLSAEEPGVVALGPNLDLDGALAIAAAFDRERPDISVLLVAEPTATLWEKALRSGARDVIDPTSEDGVELREIIERARSTTDLRRARTTGVSALPEPASSHVVVVLSPKGGSGKTTVASNLAVNLNAQYPGEVVLVDLDLQFGDIATSLRLEPEYTIADTVGGEVTSTSLKAYLTLHPSSQLAVLCAPDKPEEAEDIGADHVKLVLSTLQTQFEWVIVDTGAGLDDATLAASELSTDAVFVAPTDVASIRSLRKEIEIFDRVGLASGNRHFVLNRGDARVGLDPSDIAESLGVKNPVSMPSSQSVPLAANQGTPLVELDPRSGPALSIAELSGRMTGRESVQPARRRFFGLGA